MWHGFLSEVISEILHTLIKTFYNISEEKCITFGNLRQGKSMSSYAKYD